MPATAHSFAMRSVVPILLLMLFLSSCGGPRYTVIPWAKATKLEGRLEMQILDIYDGLHYSREPHVSHLVEVEIIDGPESLIGQRICLPYDRYNTGTEPPSPGETVFVAPSSWLKRNPRNFGR